MRAGTLLTRVGTAGAIVAGTVSGANVLAQESTSPTDEEAERLAQAAIDSSLVTPEAADPRVVDLDQSTALATALTNELGRPPTSAELMEHVMADASPGEVGVVTYDVRSLTPSADDVGLNCQDGNKCSGDTCIFVDGVGTVVLAWSTTTKQYPSDGTVCDPSGYFLANFYTDDLWIAPGCYQIFPNQVNEFYAIRHDTPLQFADGTLLANTWTPGIYSGTPYIEIKG